MARADLRLVETWLRRACVTLPLLMLAANLVSWLRWGTDLPYLDDWRAYDERNALSFAAHRLFEPINNTISPLGLALDALAQRWLGGNPLPYQSITMLVVLGGLMWLQWRLLGWVLRDKTAQAVAFALTFFMLQAGTYWGEQNLAYHQALPPLALLAAVLLTWRGGMASPVRFALTVLLGLAAGLSYISGAIAALVMGACLWGLVVALRQSAGQHLMSRAWTGAAALTLAGALTTALQIGLTRRAGQRVQILELTWPDAWEFWVYLLGKIGRGSGRAFACLALEVAWVCALVALLVAALVWLALNLYRRPRRSASLQRLTLVALPLIAMVLAYLALIALGRAGYRDAEVDTAAAVFRFAYQRFHFFWVTLLFPWLAAIWLAFLRTSRQSAVRRGHVPVAVVTLLLACGLGFGRGVFKVDEGYKSASAYRATEIRCIARQLGTDSPITCPGFDLMGITDLTRAYEYARDIDASFVRHFPIVARDRLGTEWTRWQRVGDRAAVRWYDATSMAEGWWVGGADPRAVVALPATTLSPARCLTMGVRLELKTRQSGYAQVFYRRLGETAYQEPNSVSRSYRPDSNGEVSLEFVVESPSGFEPELRIDPSGSGGQWQITDMRIACRLRMQP